MIAALFRIFLTILLTITKEECIFMISAISGAKFNVANHKNSSNSLSNEGKQSVSFKSGNYSFMKEVEKKGWLEAISDFLDPRKRMTAEELIKYEREDAERDRRRNWLGRSR